MKWLAVALIVMLDILPRQQAQAQMVFIDPPTPSAAQKPEGRHQLNFEFLRRRTPRVFSDQRWPQVLGQKLDEIRNVPYQSCQSEFSYDYALSLTAQGKLEQCLQYVENCSQRRRNIDVATLIQGARCGKMTHQLQRTFDLLSNAYQSRSFNSEMASALTLEFALFAEYSIFSDQTDRIISRHPFWSSEERTYAKSLIEFLGKTSPKVKTKEQVFNYLDQQIPLARGYYKNLLNTYKSSLLMGESKVAENHEHLTEVIPQLTNPLDWWPLAFQTQYRLSENADFTKTIRLYRAFLPHAHQRSYLPSEQNVYTYSQITQDICKRKMLQGNEKTQLTRQLRSWKNGEISLRQIISQIEQQNINISQKSDLLSTYAGLLVIDNQLDRAREYYWRSHLACPYNNRSHWGLILLERKNKYRAYPEYQKNVEEVSRTISQISYPAEIESYIVNWNSFPEESRQRIKYGARIWAPFIKTLNDANFKTYIKLPFELLSEAPGFASIKDERIGPPDMPNYKLDNRLWDDVRGAGGQFVISDHDETFETVHGDYNLLGHEIAHQFHAYLDRYQPGLSDCIETLYGNAKQRKKFPDSYAATNSREYFAQGITYFLIPEDAPSRYGINVSWYPENDPDLYRLMQSIALSEGVFSRISCPL